MGEVKIGGSLKIGAAATLIFMLTGAASAQQTQKQANEWHHSVIEQELTNERGLALDLTSAADDLGASLRAIEKTAPQSVKDLIDWKTLTADESKFESNARFIRMAVDQVVSNDQEFLGAPTLADTDDGLRAIYQNLLVRARLHRNFSDNLKVLDGLLASMDKEFQALPREGADFTQVEHCLRTARAAIDERTQYWGKISSQYLTVLKSTDVRVFFKQEAAPVSAAVQPQNPPPSPAIEQTPSKGQRIASAIGDISARIYLAHYCPQVRQVAVAFMNANQYQLLQTCIAWGY